MEVFIIRIISKISNIKASKISLKTSFENLNIDILDLVEIVMLIEDKLEITADDNIYDVKTVGELIENIKQLIKKN